jgi:hypothetical protein
MLGIAIRRQKMGNRLQMILHILSNAMCQNKFSLYLKKMTQLIEQLQMQYTMVKENLEKNNIYKRVIQ